MVLHNTSVTNNDRSCKILDIWSQNYNPDLYITEELNQSLWQTDEKGLV